MDLRIPIIALAGAGLFLSACASTDDDYDASYQYKRSRGAVYHPEETGYRWEEDRDADVTVAGYEENGGARGWREPGAGDWEFTLGAQGVNDKDFDNGAASLGTSFGYMFNEVFQVSLRQNVTYSDFGDSDWNGSTRVAADFHLPMGRFRPFLGANFGWVYGDSIDDTLAAAPEVGFKYYIHDDAFIMGIAEYQFFFEDAGDADDAFDDGQFVYGLGIGLRF